MREVNCVTVFGGSGEVFNLHLNIQKCSTEQNLCVVPMQTLTVVLCLLFPGKRR